MEQMMSALPAFGTKGYEPCFTYSTPVMAPLSLSRNAWREGPGTMLFLPFSYGQLAMTKPLKGPKEPKVGNAKGLNFLRSHPRVWKINITHTMHLTSLQRRLKTKIQVKNHSKKRETWLPRIMIINKSRFFENLVWRGLDRMIMTYFSTQDFRITKLQWHFRTLLNLALSL